MSDKPRRAWFRIHLSTAVVLMVVAGGFIGMNFVERMIWLHEGNSNYLLGSPGLGWPIWFWRYSEIPGDGYEEFHWLRLLANGALLVLFLAAVACLVETLIRRREARAADKSRGPRFQIQLSTAIVLMFVAGGLLWANERVQDDIVTEPFPFLVKNARGWPMHFFIFNTMSKPEAQYWVWENLLINLLTSIGLLILTATILERILRRREARAP